MSPRAIGSWCWERGEIGAPVLCRSAAPGGPQRNVLGDRGQRSLCRRSRALGVCDAVIRADARDPLAVRAAVLQATRDREADLAVSCVNVAGVEPTAILLTRPRGKVYFFAMSTSFTAAALGAEGMGRDIDMYIGNGYAEATPSTRSNLVRAAPALRDILARRYA